MSVYNQVLRMTNFPWKLKDWASLKKEPSNDLQKMSGDTEGKVGITSSKNNETWN